MPRIQRHRLAPSERPPHESVKDGQRKSVLERKGNNLGPEELGLLAKRLAAATNVAEASHIKERITGGFYGI